MTDTIMKVREFQKVFGQPYSVPIDHAGSFKLQQLCFSLMQEEFNEFKKEHDDMIWKVPDEQDKANLLKEMADLVYTTYYYASTFGLPLDRAIELVHENNMTKRQPDGTVLRSDTGKILKPVGYKPVDLKVLF